MVSKRRDGVVAIVLKTNQGGTWAIPQALKLVERGKEVIFILPRGYGQLNSKLEAAGISYREVGFDFQFGNPVGVANGILELRKTLKDLRAGTVFYHLYASALASRIATFGLDMRRVHMVAGPVYLESPIIRMVETLLVHMDHCLIAGSEFTYRSYSELPGAPLAKLTMIPYGVDVAGVVPATAYEREACRADLHLDAKSFVVVMVAYFYPPKDTIGHKVGIKGHEFLLDAWREFSKNAPGSVLYLVGGGFGPGGEEYRASLMSRYDDLDSVFWAGSVSDVSRFYWAADLSISPSISENHGAAMEASAFGVPSIVSDAGGLPEMVDDHSGWVTPTGRADALAAALEAAFSEWSSGELGSRGRAARERTERLYDSARTTLEVAEAVCPLPSRSMTVVTEAHFRRGDTGGWAAVDGVNGDQQWSRYTRSMRKIKIAGRASAAAAPPEADPVTVAEVVPLPEAQGRNELLKKLPSLSIAMGRVVRSSELLVLRIPGPISLLAGVWAMLLRKEYVVEVVGDAGALLIGRTWSSKIFGGLFNRLTAVVVWRAEGARYVTAEALQRSYPSAAKMQTSISNVRLPDDLVVSTARRGIANDAVPVYLAVGTQEASYKGHQFAIQALAIVLQRRPGARLILVGDGQYQETLRTLAKSLGVSNQVDFKGKLRRGEVVDCMDSADVLLQPSITEGLPRTIIEASARALPSIGSNVAGIPELVRSDLVIEVGDVGGLADRMIRLVEDRELYQSASEEVLVNAMTFRESILDRKFDEWFTWLSGL